MLGTGSNPVRGTYKVPAGSENLQDPDSSGHRRGHRHTPETKRIDVGDTDGFSWVTAVCAVILFAVLALLPETAKAHTSVPLRQHATPTQVSRIICAVFGPYCWQARRVALCESGYVVRSWRTGTHARNGQYRGLFQMGYAERARYGHGAGAWAQARAAYRYFKASGRDWSPWQCKP